MENSTLSDLCNCCRLCLNTDLENGKTLYSDSGQKMEFYDSVSKFLHPKIVNLEIFRQMRTVCLVCTQIICHFENYQNLIQDTQNELIGEYEDVKDVEIKNEKDDESIPTAEEKKEDEDIKSEEEFMELSQTSNGNISDVVTGAKNTQDVLNEDMEESYDSETQSQDDVVREVNMSQNSVEETYDSETQGEDNIVGEVNIFRNSLDFSAKENCTPSHRKTSLTSTYVQEFSEEEASNNGLDTLVADCDSSSTNISESSALDPHNTYTDLTTASTFKLNDIFSHDIDTIALNTDDSHIDTSTLKTPSSVLESREMEICFTAPESHENSSNITDTLATDNYPHIGMASLRTPTSACEENRRETSLRGLETTVSLKQHSLSPLDTYSQNYIGTLTTPISVYEENLSELSPRGLEITPSIKPNSLLPNNSDLGTNLNMNVGALVTPISAHQENLMKTSPKSLINPSNITDILVTDHNPHGDHASLGTPISAYEENCRETTPKDIQTTTSSNIADALATDNYPHGYQASLGTPISAYGENRRETTPQEIETTAPLKHHSLLPRHTYSQNYIATLTTPISAYEENFGETSLRGLETAPRIKSQSLFFMNSNRSPIDTNFNIDKANRRTPNSAYEENTNPRCLETTEAIKPNSLLPNNSNEVINSNFNMCALVTPILAHQENLLETSTRYFQITTPIKSNSLFSNNSVLSPVDTNSNIYMASQITPISGYEENLGGLETTPHRKPNYLLPNNADIGTNSNFNMCSLLTPISAYQENRMETSTRDFQTTTHIQLNPNNSDLSPVDPNSNIDMGTPNSGFAENLNEISPKGLEATSPIKCHTSFSSNSDISPKDRNTMATLTTSISAYNENIIECPLRDAETTSPIKSHSLFSKKSDMSQITRNSKIVTVTPIPAYEETLKEISLSDDDKTPTITSQSLHSKNTCYNMDIATPTTPISDHEINECNSSKTILNKLPLAKQNSSPNSLDAATNNTHTNIATETLQISNPAQDPSEITISPNPESNSPIDSFSQNDPENLLIPIASPETETNPEKNQENALNFTNSEALVRPLKCRFCSNTYSGISSLCTHIRRHHRNSQKLSHHCKYCQRKFATRRGLNVHCSQLHRHFKAAKRIIHSDGTSVYACQQCDQVFANYSIFSSHRWHVHLLPTKYTCKITPIPVLEISDINASQSGLDKLPVATQNSSANNLDAPSNNTHTNIATETLPTSNPSHDPDNSPIDSFSQTDPENLLIPIATPETETIPEAKQKNILNSKNSQPRIKPFKCHLCSKSYPYRSNLRYHLRQHQGGSRNTYYHCKDCQRNFSTPKGLSLHYSASHRSMKSPKRITQSDGTDVYACQECDYTSTRYQVFSTHRWYCHNLPSNYICPVCGEKFNNSASVLQQHKIKEHGYIICEFCNKLCSSHKALREHQRIKHSAKYAEVKAKRKLEMEERRAAKVAAARKARLQAVVEAKAKHKLEMEERRSARLAAARKARLQAAIQAKAKRMLEAKERKAAKLAAARKERKASKLAAARKELKAAKLAEDRKAQKQTEEDKTVKNSKWFYKCPSCPTSFINRSNLELHCRIDHSINI
ncbi:uncharacterized protein [Musca autumnalis]|uniref:uncharacterized protein n=1 Tax=Musca autumnalis TaxID=221902 RepID=UPI003CEBE0B5